MKPCCLKHLDCKFCPECGSQIGREKSLVPLAPVTTADFIKRNLPLPLGDGMSPGGTPQNGEPEARKPSARGLSGPLDLRFYSHPLPENITEIIGDLILTLYKHPLPSGLEKITGNVDLRGYKFPLPEGLTDILGDVDASNYRFPLPTGLQSVSGHLKVFGHAEKLPQTLVHAGSLDMRFYPHDLPPMLEVKGDIIGKRGKVKKFETTPPPAGAQ